MENFALVYIELHVEDTLSQVWCSFVLVVHGGLYLVKHLLDLDNLHVYHRVDGELVATHMELRLWHSDAELVRSRCRDGNGGEGLTRVALIRLSLRAC